MMQQLQYESGSFHFFCFFFPIILWKEEEEEDDFIHCVDIHIDRYCR